MSEPTSKLNNLSSETVTKLVSIIVAIVVFAVVLVPIVNGLADGNGDGGDGGSGESEKIYLNTFEDTYGFELPPYKSYQFYNSNTTPVLPQEITYTLEDLREIEQQLSQISVYPGYLFTIVSASDSTGDGASIFFSSTQFSVDIHEGGTGSGVTVETLTSFSLTISTDYSLSCSYVSTVYGTKSIETTAETVDLFSESEDGWMKIIEDHDIKLTSGCELWIGGEVYDGEDISLDMNKTVILQEEMFSENHLRFTVEFDNGYSSDIYFAIQPTDTEGVWQSAENLYDYLAILKDSGGNELSQDDGLAYISLVSTYGYTQSESGSGSSTDSGGISGTAGTILKIIPVLVGVGVILAIVALFYDPRNLIRKD